MNKEQKNAMTAINNCQYTKSALISLVILKLFTY